MLLPVDTKSIISQRIGFSLNFLIIKRSLKKQMTTLTKSDSNTKPTLYHILIINSNTNRLMTPYLSTVLLRIKSSSGQLTELYMTSGDTSSSRTSARLRATSAFNRRSSTDTVQPFLDSFPWWLHIQIASRSNWRWSVSSAWNVDSDESNMQS